ncbi:MAG: YqgE/AlgH family protein [Pseudomonadota bacterium]
MSMTRFPSLDLSRGFGGKMLIAMPHLDDSPFEHSVVLMCSHDEEHAFGVIINKPIEDLSVDQVMSEADLEGSAYAAESPVFFGGPVEMQRGAVLHSLDYRSKDTFVIADGIGLTASEEALEIICDPIRAPQSSMLVMGHAGWGPNQLDDEVKRNAWLSIPSAPALVFGKPDQCWSGALGILGITDVNSLGGSEDTVARPN